MAGSRQQTDSTNGASDPDDAAAASDAATRNDTAVVDPTFERHTDSDPADTGEQPSTAAPGEAKTGAALTDRMETEVDTDQSKDAEQSADTGHSPDTAGTVENRPDTTADQPPAADEAVTGTRWRLRPRPRAQRTPQPSEPDSDADTRPERRRLVATVVVLAAVALIATGLAAWFRGEADQLRSSVSAENTALVDVATTKQVNDQITDALEAVYSYDFNRLDENQRAGSAVVTGKFAQDYRMLFDKVRELAPPEQVVVSAVVVSSAVKVLDGDRALLLVFLNQEGVKGVNGEPIGAAGRLQVTAQRVDGQWKIAAVQHF